MNRKLFIKVDGQMIEFTVKRSPGVDKTATSKVFLELF